MKPRLLRKYDAREAAQPMLEHFAALNKRTQAARKVARESEVGIFWVYDGRLLMDTTPLSEAFSWGDYKTHERAHDKFWLTLQRNDVVPRDVEYDEVPRGRVGYNTKERRFYLLVDACIKKDQAMIDRIERELNLPSNTVVDLDSHYKCPGCATPPAQVKRLERDWDL
jgi:hypothetical protein